MITYDDILERIKENALSVTDDNYWIHFNTINLKVTQGWKIHISFIEDEFYQIYCLILKDLINLGQAFKVPLNLSKLHALNSGQYGEEQIGKCLTIYPNSILEFKSLLKKITQVWKSSNAAGVASEPRLVSGSPVSFRYGDFVGSIYIDDFGVPQRYLLDENKKRLVDSLSVTFSRISELELEYFVDENPRIKFLETISSRYTIIKKNAKSSHITVLALQTKEPFKVTIKIALKRDDKLSQLNYLALKNEVKILNELTEKRFDFAPNVLETIESDDCYAIVLNYIDGVSFAEIKRDDVESSIYRLEEAVKSLHALGIVHGDIKEENLVWNGKQAFLIDFGSAGFIGDRKEFDLKTPGYFDVKKDRDLFDCSIDFYALKMVYFNLETGCRVGHIKNDLVTLTSLYQISSKTNNCGYFLKELPQSTTISQKPSFSPTKIVNAALDFFDLHNGKWFNGHEYSNFHMPNLNIGAAGIVLSLLRIRSYIDQTIPIDSYIVHSLEALYKQDHSKNSKGLYTGNAGVGLTFLICGKILGIERFIDFGFRLLEESLVTSNQNFDYFSGAAGAIVATIVANEQYRLEKLDQALIQSTEKLLSQVQIKDGFIGIVNTRTGFIETGLAHGSAGIAFCLDHLAKYFCDSGIKKLSTDIYENIFTMGNHGAHLYFDSSKQEVSPNAIWCKGSGGVLWGLLNGAEALIETSDQINCYAKMFTSSLHLTNPTLCHGMAGQLELIKKLKLLVPEEKRLEQEHNIRERIELMIIEKNNKQYFLSENMEYVTPDLWVGFLGTACALIEDDFSQYSILSPNFFRFLR